jgi:hypothetical protein
MMFFLLLCLYFHSSSPYTYTNDYESWGTPRIPDLNGHRPLPTSPFVKALKSKPFPLPKFGSIVDLVTPMKLIPDRDIRGVDYMKNVIDWPRYLELLQSHKNNNASSGYTSPACALLLMLCLFLFSSLAVCILSSTGESVMITNDERSRMIKFALRVLRGQLPLIVGVEGIQRTHMMSLLKNAYWNGADAALVILPYAMNPPQQGVVRRFVALAEAVRELPIIIDNNPDRCAIDLLPESFDEIMEKQVYPTIIGIKDSSKDCVVRVEKYRSIAGNDFKIYW